MEKKLLACSLIFVFLAIYSPTIKAQYVDIGSIGKGKAFKISGSLNANSIYYSSNRNSNRVPFTYFLQGLINLSLYSFSMPISYSFTNQGNNLTYSLPFKFNRLSLHPKYNWLQAHLGDVHMVFSPYTLNGHEFTGVGIELTPKGSFKYSAMAGRLLKGTEYDGNEQTIPAYKRIGYGINTKFEKENYSIKLIGFYSKDQQNSIAPIPDEKEIFPMENLVFSIEGGVSIDEHIKLFAEMSTSALTSDLRAKKAKDNGKGITGLFINNKISTEYYKALKTGLNYAIGISSIGINYERIDPGYKTLGAYFFNNDFENFNINAATLLFDKIKLAFNLGSQRDDLDNQKQQKSRRMVGSINANINLSEKLAISGAFSNLSTYTNVKPNQFDYINDDNLIDNELDRLNYKQLSKNANLNVNYAFEQSDKLLQNLNFNYTFADVSDEQDGVIRIGDASTFHNFNTVYSLTIANKNINISTILSATYHTIGREDVSTFGPTVSVSKKFLKNTLNTSIAASYNTSKNIGNTTNITNFRTNVTYVYKKKHSFNLSSIVQFHTNSNTLNSNEFTTIFAYNYRF